VKRIEMGIDTQVVVLKDYFAQNRQRLTKEFLIIVGSLALGTIPIIVEFGSQKLTALGLICAWAIMAIPAITFVTLLFIFVGMSVSYPRVRALGERASMSFDEYVRSDKYRTANKSFLRRTDEVLKWF